MSLFEITPEIQLLAKPITPGRHGLEVTKIEDSINDKGVKVTLFTHKVLDGPHKGAYVWNRIAHDENMAYSFQYLDFISKGAFSRPVKGAEKKELTLDNIVKRFDADIVNKDVDGRTMNNIKRLYPYTEKKQVAQPVKA